jgi:hypothetical protein
MKIFSGILGALTLFVGLGLGFNQASATALDQFGCPATFTMTSADAYPNADLNDDGIVCEKTTGDQTIVVDNFHSGSGSAPSPSPEE